jgi:molybdopterin-guanine dinucleotide biosynthesis protein B
MHNQYLRICSCLIHQTFAKSPINRATTEAGVTFSKSEAYFSQVLIMVFRCGGVELKAVGIIGYKNSGKTSLLMNLARELTARGHTVCSVKHVSCDLDLPGTDTALHRKYVRQVAAISPEESAIFFRESVNLEEMLNYLKADLVLVEGFKKEKTFPKIVCLRPGDDPKELLDGLEICIVGARPDNQIDVDVPILDAESDVRGVTDLKNSIRKIADLVEEKAFKLPNLDCGGCGYKTCYELALQIVKGAKTIDDCRSLNADVQIKIDDRILPAKPFISDLVRNTITGLLSSLKGYRKGKIDIKIE